MTMFSNKYLQTYKLINIRYDLVDVIQHIVVLLDRVFKEPATNKEDVEQLLRLVDVAKGLLHLRQPFTTLNVPKLVVCQVEVDDEHELLNAPLIVL
jgi:hypothetical protein